MNDTTKQASTYWNDKAKTRMQDRVRWWQSPTIVKHINEMVCGEPIAGGHAGFHRLMAQENAGKAFARAVSVGCGSGQKEIGLVRAGIVERFDLYEISSERISFGRGVAKSNGVEDRVTFHEADAFALKSRHEYDLVYWNNSLHHMPVAADAVKWSKAVLLPGGLFAADEYVGPNRFQWSDRALAFANGYHAALPVNLRANPADPSRTTAPPVRPTVEAMIKADPSESADSENIIPSIIATFPDATIIPTGGAIYHLGLKDIMANMEEDSTEMKLALLLDDALMVSGENFYAVAIGRKPE